MNDPVCARDGHTYERAHISRWLAANDTSPMTNCVLVTKELVPNFALRNAIVDWLEARRPQRAGLIPSADTLRATCLAARLEQVNLLAQEIGKCAIAHAQAGSMCFEDESGEEKYIALFTMSGYKPWMDVHAASLYVSPGHAYFARDRETEFVDFPALPPSVSESPMISQLSSQLRASGTFVSIALINDPCQYPVIGPAGLDGHGSRAGCRELPVGVWLSWEDELQSVSSEEAIGDVAREASSTEPNHESASEPSVGENEGRSGHDSLRLVGGLGTTGSSALDEAELSDGSTFDSDERQLAEQERSLQRLGLGEVHITAETLARHYQLQTALRSVVSVAAVQAGHGIQPVSRQGYLWQRQPQVDNDLFHSARLPSFVIPSGSRFEAGSSLGTFDGLTAAYLPAPPPASHRRRPFNQFAAALEVVRSSNEARPSV